MNRVSQGLPVSKRMRMRACWAGFVLVLMTLGPGSALAQRGTTFSEQDFEVAFSFFSAGGTWAFRLMPPSNADAEATWKVLILRARGSTKTSFQLGAAELSPKASISSASKVLDLYDADRATLVQFLRRYADRVEKGEFEAFLAAIPPMKEGERVALEAAVALTKGGLLDLLTMPGGQTAAPKAVAAQTSGGSIEGTVIRAENTPVAGAEVKLRRMAGDGIDKTGEVRIVKTAEDGTFAFRALEAGTYTLSISTKYADESMLPCKPSGLLARNRNKWLMAVAQTADGGIVQIVTSGGLTVEGGQTRSETVDLRCRTHGGAAPLVVASLLALPGAQTAPRSAVWPPLPPDFAGDFTMDMATMRKLAGDAIALPIAGQFKTLSITAVEDDGTVTLKDLVIDTRLSGQPFKVTIHALHSHVTTEARGRYAMQGQGVEGSQVPFVWHSFHVESPGGARMHLMGVYRDGALLGYSYERSQLAGLSAGAALPVFGRTGWQVVTVLGPPTGNTMKIEGGSLRLFDAPGNRVGLVRP